MWVSTKAACLEVFRPKIPYLATLPTAGSFGLQLHPGPGPCLHAAAPGSGETEEGSVVTGPLFWPVRYRGGGRPLQSPAGPARRPSALRGRRAPLGGSSAPGRAARLVLEPRAPVGARCCPWCLPRLQLCRGGTPGAGLLSPVLPGARRRLAGRAAVRPLRAGTARPGDGGLVLSLSSTHVLQPQVGFHYLVDFILENRAVSGEAPATPSPAGTPAGKYSPPSPAGT